MSRKEERFSLRFWRLTRENINVILVDVFAASINRSILPFASGLYGAVKMSFMPKTAQARSIHLLRNCLPLSKLWVIPHSFDYNELLTIPKNMINCLFSTLQKKFSV
jgi:hypothetical protein